MLVWTHVHVRACYRICRVYLPIIVDGPDAFLFALSVEPVVLFIYLFRVVVRQNMIISLNLTNVG